MSEDGFQRVTIIPLPRPGQPNERAFHIQVEGTPPSMWTDPGWYQTPEAVLASFKLPLKQSLQQTIIETLSEGEAISFSLKDAFASPSEW